MPDPIETIKIIKVVNTQGSETDDVVAREAPLTVYVNDIELVTLLCTPDYLPDLAVGFLYSEGVISAIDDIKNISVNDSKGIAWVTLREGIVVNEDDFRRGRAVTSGCAKGQTFGHLLEKQDLPIINTKIRFPIEQLYSLILQFQNIPSTYRQTGCVHVAGLYLNDDNWVVREDIGRHNAVDKVVGYCMQHRIDGSDKVMMVTGRLSSEMVMKAVRLGVPVVVSRTAPTVTALRIAEEAGTTLVGFARGQRMNIYSHPYRVVLNGK